MEESNMSIRMEPFGELPDGGKVTLYILENKNGLTAGILNYGGIIVSLNVPDREGKMADIVLGYDNLSDYLDRSPYFGAIIGRHANRIEGGSFSINGVTYQLNKNEGSNHIHGGLSGFDKKLWDVRILKDEDNNESLELSHFSPDNDENYPGNLEARVIYTLTDSDCLEIDYYAASDKDTVLNMTNHSYFNLSGCDSGPILDHELKINADFYTPVNNELLPTGEILSVKGTPFDFTTFKAIGEGLRNYAENEQMKIGSGYDHNFVLNVSGKEPEEACQVYDPKTGRLMKVLTTMPGVQFYSGNYLESAGAGKNGTVYGKWHGFCLETQYFPNSMKYRHFPSPVLKAGHTYHHKTIFQFGTK